MAFSPFRNVAVPASFFGMPLGLLALGIAWRAATGLWGVPYLVGEALILVGGCLWFLLFALYLAKWAWSRDAARSEFAHPVQCCFVGLAGTVASLASIGMAPHAHAMALALFVLGGTWTLVFALYRTGHLWMGERAPESSTAVLYLPTVAGGLVTGSAAAALGHPDWGQLAFGAGLFAWLAIESVLLHRLYTAAPMAPALRPTMGIQLAPPAVAAVAYLNVGGGADLFAHALVGYSLLQTLIVLRMWPWLRAAGATPGWWGVSFGAAALPTAAIKMAAKGDEGPMAVLAPWLFGAGNVVIATLVAMTIVLLVRGRLLPPASLSRA